MKLPKKVLRRGDGYYCSACCEPRVERTYRGNLTFYKCGACAVLSPRCIVMDSGITWWSDEQKNYWHESVGVVAFNDAGKILCINRKIFPFALALPAGHLDAGEDPATGANRELTEETGVVPANINLVSIFDMPGDSCRRGSDHHRWHLYAANVGEQAAVSRTDEASGAVWLKAAEITEAQSVSYALRYINEKFDLQKMQASAAQLVV